MRAVLEILVDIAPHEGLVEQHIGSVRLMHQRGAGRDGLLGIEHEGQRLVADIDRFGRILGLRSCVGHDGSDPFAGIARNVRRASGRRGTFGVSSPVISGSVASASSRPSTT